MRQLGTFEFSGNLEVKIKGLIDARMFVSSYADLLTYTPANYLFNGFPVVVWDTDPTKRGIYQLVDENNLANPNSWVNISGSATVPTGLQETLDQIELDLAALELAIATANTNATNASSAASAADTKAGNALTAIDTINLTLTSINAALADKADLIGPVGNKKVPMSQLPIMGLTRPYHTIAERDLDSDLSGVVFGLVNDPSDDPDNIGLTQPQLYVNTSSGWKIYQGLGSSIVGLAWEDIDGIPSATPQQIDETVASLNDLVACIADLTVGAWEAGQSLQVPAVIAPAVNKFINRTFTPTFTAPSFALGNSVGLKKIGEVVPVINLTFTFNRGAINGAIVNNTWNPAAKQNDRAGDVNGNGYTIHGVTQASNVLAVGNHTVIKGANPFTGTVSYLAGPQPLDSKEQNFDNPLPAGTSPEQTTSFEGVYPIFATTQSIGTMTEQQLYSMLSANNIVIDLIGEANGNKQSIELPNDWLNSRDLISIQYFNTVSNQYDPTNKLDDFTVSAVSKNINANAANIPYTKFTHNKSDRGAIKIRLIFA